MKTSKLLLTSLLAAATMSAPAFATTLADATLAIESFTQENIDALGTAGWTVSGITISETDGTFTTTATTEGGTQPSITAAGGSSNTLSTNVSTSSTARYAFSTIVTVDASLFSGTGSGNIIAGSQSSNGNVSTADDIGVGFSSGNITGVFNNVVWNNAGNRTLDVSNTIINGKVTIGLVFAGNLGVDIYLADGSTAKISGLKTSINYNAISLSDKVVTYSNLYWFNTALSGADMQAAVASATGARLASLTWAGGTSGTWDYESDTNWTMPGESGTVSTAFQDLDGVTFATDGAQVELTQSSGSYLLKDLTVSAATSLTGTGTVRVAVSNLTTDAALTLGDNVVLDLGSISAATNKTISGTGTVKVVSSSTNNNGTPDHNGTLTLGSGFSGTIEYSGKFDTSNGTNNPNAKFALSNGSMWGGGTIRNDIHFLTNYQLGDSSATTIVLNGNLTQEAGTTLTIANANITFGGSATLGTLTKNSGTLTVSGDGIKNITTLNVNGGATTIGGSNTSITTLNVGTAYGMTFSGSAIVGTFNGNKAAMFNIGEGSDATKVVSVGRLNLGNTTDTGTNTLAVKSDSVFKVTGTTNSGTNNQVSIILGRESSKTLINVQGKFLAAGATAIAGKSGFEITVENGGVFAVNGLAQYTSANTPTMKLTLNDGGTAIFGAGGFSTLNTGTTWECSLGAGTFGTSNAGGLTISKNMTLTSATGTTFDTQLWNFASDGNDIARSADTASAITVNGVISGDGALKKSGAGMLTLSNANIYTGGTVIEAGTVVAAHASALGTTKGVEVQSGATLNLGAPAVTVAGLSGAGRVGLADGRTSSMLTVDSATDSTFSGSLEGAIALVKQGAGTLELSGNNTMFVYPAIDGFNPGVDVRAGTVRIVQTGNFQSFTNVSVADGATLELSTVSDAIAVNATSVVLSSTAKILVDMSNYASDADIVAVNLISASALSYGSDTITSNNVDLLLGAIELKNWGDGWTQSLSYAGSTLTLTLTIPEPSAFGLLAGLGALALAGTRRRRRK